MDKRCSFCGSVLDREPTNESDYYCSPCRARITVVKVGLILHTSWGYDQTNNEYAQIVKISPTGKTVMCRMMRTQVVKENGYSREIVPFEAYGPEFRLHVRKYGVSPRIYFVGQFPYCIDSQGNGKDTMSGSFCGWDEKPDMDTER